MNIREGFAICYANYFVNTHSTIVVIAHKEAARQQYNQPNPGIYKNSFNLKYSSHECI